MSSCSSRGSSMGDSEKCSTIFAHLPCAVDSMDIAEYFVKKKWAASVSILPGISRIRASEKNNAKLETETLLIINTKPGYINEMTTYIREKIPNSPQNLNVIAIPIEDGNVPFLKWVGDQTENAGKSDD